MSIHNALNPRREFERQGYVHYRSFFSAAEVWDLQQEIKTTGESLRTADYLNKDTMIFYSNVFRRSEYVRAFISQEKIVELLRQVAGPDCWAR